MRPSVAFISGALLLACAVVHIEARLGDELESFHDELISPFDGDLQLREEPKPRSLFWGLFGKGDDKEKADDSDPKPEPPPPPPKGGKKVSGNEPWWYKEGLGSEEPTDPPSQGPPPPPPHTKHKKKRPAPPHEDGSMVGSYVSLKQNCTEPEDKCDLNGEGVDGIFICRKVPLVLQVHARSEVTKCIDPEFAHSTDKCGCCDGKCAPPCPCPCKLTGKENDVYGTTFTNGFSLTLEDDDSRKFCVPQAEIDTMAATTNAKCDMSCPEAAGQAANHIKGEDGKEKELMEKDKGNSTGSENDTGDDEGGEVSWFSGIFGGNKESGNSDEDGG